VCPRSTKALLMAMAVRSCVTDGEKIFDGEDMDWRERMRESSWAHQERIDMVADARTAEMDAAARAGRRGRMWCPARHA
jgi:hypothetical protein